MMTEILDSTSQFFLCIYLAFGLGPIQLPMLQQLSEVFLLLSNSEPLQAHTAMINKVMMN